MAILRNAINKNLLPIDLYVCAKDSIIDPMLAQANEVRVDAASGKVTLALSIDATGRVVDVSVVRSDPPGFFEASALAAFRSAPFAPGIKGGRPVQSRIQTVVVFELGAR